MRKLSSQQVTTGSSGRTEHSNIEQIETGNVLILTRLITNDSWTAEDSYYDNEQGDFEYLPVPPTSQDVERFRMDWPTFQSMAVDLSAQGFEVPNELQSLVDAKQFVW